MFHGSCSCITVFLCIYVDWEFEGREKLKVFFKEELVRVRLQETNNFFLGFSFFHTFIL